MTDHRSPPATCSTRRPLARRPRDPRVAGLYAVTPDVDDTERLAAMVDAALEGGASLVQYRNKTANAALRKVQAARLASLCRAHDRLLVVNDDIELAASIDGAGLHVGATDFDGPSHLFRLRERLGPTRVIGVSCYRSLDRAYEAADAGADYVAFGSVFPSTTKPAAPPAPLRLFEAARNLGIALVGIGGVGAANLPALVAAGADAAAVIGELFAAGDATAIAAKARALGAAFRRVA